MSPSPFDELRSVCEKHNIGLMYVFGSRQEAVLNRLRDPTADIEWDGMADADAGVVFRFPLEDRTPSHKLYSALFTDLEDLVKPLPLDLVLLQQCHSVMQYEAIKGSCVYEISERFREEFEMSVLRRVPDFRKMLRKFNQELLEETL